MIGYGLKGDPPEFAVYRVVKDYLGPRAQQLVFAGIERKNQFALFQLLLAACDLHYRRPDLFPESPILKDGN